MKKKTYVLTLSRVFPKTHPNAGINTGFEEAIGMGIKIHTIRGNYPLWEKRIAKINEGKAVLSVRCWQNEPYRSKQIKLFEFDEIGIQKAEFKEDGLHIWDVPYIVDYVEVALNDGLMLEHFEDWFTPRPTEAMAIIHFTDFRY